MALLDLHGFIANVSKLSISGRSLILREDENESFSTVPNLGSTDFKVPKHLNWDIAMILKTVKKLKFDRSFSFFNFIDLLKPFFVRNQNSKAVELFPISMIFLVIT
jgi:hypothetical protein